MLRLIGIPASLLLLALSSISAQAPLPGRLSLGPFVGLNYTTFGGGSDATDSDWHMGYAIGGQLDYEFGYGGLFRTGLIYSRRGAENSESGITNKAKLDYVEVPVLLGYQVVTSSAVRPYFIGGANVAFNTGCTFESTDGSVTASAPCDDPSIDAQISSTDVALVVGGGLTMPAGVSSFRLDVRYAFGLTSIAKDSNAKNRGFTLGVAYMIPIGR